jgi:transcription antitermination factor NusG
LPLRAKLTVRKGRRFKSLLPLFSGYVFFNGNEDTRYTALTSNRIAQVIEVVDQSKLVHELNQIHSALSKGAPLDPHPHLQQGDRCRVIGGPFVGTEGFLLQKKNLTKLVLQVDILGQAAAMEIDADLLEPIQ